MENDGEVEEVEALKLKLGWPGVKDSSASSTSERESLLAIPSEPDILRV